MTSPVRLGIVTALLLVALPAYAQQQVALILPDSANAELELSVRDEIGKRNIMVVDRASTVAALQFAAGELDAAALRSMGKQLNATWVIRVEEKWQGGKLAIRATAVTASDSAARFALVARRDRDATVPRLVGEVLDTIRGTATGQGMPAAAATPAQPTPTTLPAPRPTPAVSTTPGGSPAQAPTSITATENTSLPIPGLIPPPTVKPIPLADPAKPFRPINALKEGLIKPSPFVLYANVAPAFLWSLAKGGGDTNFGFQVNFGGGATISKKHPLHVGGLFQLTAIDGGSQLTMGPAIGYNGANVGIITNTDDAFILDDAFMIAMHGNLALWRSGSINHGIAVNLTMGMFYDPFIYTGILSVGYTAVFGSHLPDARAINRYRERVWDQQSKQASSRAE